MPRCHACLMSVPSTALVRTNTDSLECYSCSSIVDVVGTKVPTRREVVSVRIVETGDEKKDLSLAFDIRTSAITISGEYTIDQIRNFFSRRSSKKERA